MALPKIQHVMFAVDIPSLQKKVKMRPFTVREEKILLAATQIQTYESVVDAIQQILTNCIVDDEVDVSKLAMFDIEYLFLALRAQSVNNVIDVQQEHEGKVYTGTINLDEIEVVRHEEHQNNIKLDDEVGVIMRYPDFNIARSATETTVEAEQIFEMIMHCIEKIYDTENVQTSGIDFTKDELEEFVYSLPADGFSKISKFFETMPSIQGKVVLSTTDGEQHEFTLKGLNDFF